MQLHQLHPKHKSKRKKRIGRGGKRGTFSGRGVKGQKSRSGRKLEPIVRGLIKKYPKLRGYKFNEWKTKPVVVSIGSLERFETGEKINPSVLLEKKIIPKIKGRVPKVKILGKGELTKALTIENCDISKSAREKVEKAGGKIK
ncbi:50S ribosomal protein L15 [Candidatus Parcubacteria bacterium]|nr:50S ribosomal protein L15 [Candidatus Parcubacteria bacterium]